MSQSEISTTADAVFFQQELLRWHPDSSYNAANMCLEDCFRYSKSWAVRQYENFTVVSWLLPREFRQDFYNIYAYCRWSDNLADEVSDSQESLRLLDWWQSELKACPAGQPRHPVIRALQHTIVARQLTLDPFLQLLSAFRQDRRVNRYASQAELIDYCCRSANPVGRILLELAGASNSENDVFSDHVCTGLQLANFCQDMFRDARKDRIYAPEELYTKHSVTSEMILAGQVTDELKNMLREWVQSTQHHFAVGRGLVPRVPRWLATDVDLFIRGGEATLNAIRKCDYDVWTRRPTVSKFQKVGLLLFSMGSRLLASSQSRVGAQR